MAKYGWKRESCHHFIPICLVWVSFSTFPFLQQIPSSFDDRTIEVAVFHCDKRRKESWLTKNMKNKIKENIFGILVWRTSIYFQWKKNIFFIAIARIFQLHFDGPVRVMARFFSPWMNFTCNAGRTTYRTAFSISTLSHVFSSRVCWLRLLP